jgi:hypothetical protein
MPEEKRKRTGITEVAAVTAALGFLEPEVSYLTGHSIVPDPWDKLLLGVLGVGIYFLRRAAKKADA